MDIIILLMDNIKKDILEPINGFIHGLVFEFSGLITYLMSDNNEQPATEQLCFSHVTKTGTLYDFYYWLLIKKGKSQTLLTRYEIQPFNYPNDFEICHPSLIIKFSVDNTKNAIMSQVIINDKLIQKPLDDYNDGIKEHTTYNSLKNDIDKLSEKYIFNWTE